MIHLVADDGTTFMLSGEEAARLYDELWKIAGTRGAVSAASKLLHASKASAAQQQELIAAQQRLTPSESNAVRDAIGRLQRSAKTGPPSDPVLAWTPQRTNSWTLQSASAS